MGVRMVGEVGIGIYANSAKAVTGFEETRKASRATAKQIKADMLEARGGIMVLGEEIGVHLPRHVQAFVAKLPGVADLMSKAFAPVAFFAIGAAIFEAGKKVYEYGEKMKEAAKKQAEASRAFTDSLVKSNLEQQIENDKLDEKIAKLEHKPGDALKTALDEVKLAAFNLTEQLEKAINKERELLDSANTGFFSKLFGNAGTESAKAGLNAYQQKQNNEDTRFHADTNPDPHAAMLEHEKRKTAITVDYYNQIDMELKKRNRYKELTAQYNGHPSSYQINHHQADEWVSLNDEFTKTGTAGDQSKFIAERQQLQGAIGELGWGQQGLADRDVKSQKEASLTQRAEAAEIAKKSAREALEAKRAAAQAQMKAFEDELDKRRDLEEVSVGDEYAFWKEKQEALQVGSENYNKIEKTLGGLHQQMSRSMQEYYNRLPAAMAEVAHKAEEEQRKLDEAMKKAHENAADSLSLKREDAKGKYQELSEASQIRVETGQESNGQRIKDLKKALDEEHQLETDSYKDQADLYAVGTDEYTDVLKKKHKADFEYFKEYTALQKQAMEQGPTGAINDLIRRGTDYAAQSKELIDSTFNTLNDSLLKMMTSQYHKGDWKNAGKSVFTGVAKTGLQDAEGSLMKGLFGGKRGESKSKPMYVQDVGLGSVGGIGSASGAASVADSASQSGGFFNGFFKGIGSFFGGMETGGLMKPGGFYLTGERGPELLRVGSTTRINNARDTSRIMSSGGGSHVEHHYHIDARGATDPAAVTAAINRAISRAAPQIAASSIAAFQDMKARRPSIYG
jgi:hypothetical protein